MHVAASDLVQMSVDRQSKDIERRTIASTMQFCLCRSLKTCTKSLDMTCIIES